MNPLYAATALLAGHRCEYCHAPEVIANFPFEVEHVVPAAAGGEDAPGNLALACRSCNLRKGVHVAAVDLQTNETVPLFHPRLERWEDHFRVNHTTYMIEGQTAVGRATIARLAINSQAQVAARPHWIRLELFP